MKIIGGILAGGLGRRMTGFDKPFAPLGGQPLIAHVVARLEPQADGILLNANADPERFASFGRGVIADRIGGHRGPLAGIHALMEEARDRGASHLLAAPADTPFLPQDLADRLTSASNDARTVRIACSNGRRHPVVALWPVSLADGLAAHLASAEDLSMAAWLRQLAIAEVDFPLDGDLDPFFNINAPSDLEKATELLAGSAG